MSPFDQQWQRLTALARQARPDLDGAVPSGFSTRVAARAAALPGAGPWAIVERFALRGLVVASVFSVAAIAYNYSILQSDQGEDYASSDTVGELLELS